MKVWLYKFSSKTSFSSWKKTPKIYAYKCRVLSISMCNTCMFYQLKDTDIRITVYYSLPLIFHFATNYWNHYIKYKMLQRHIDKNRVMFHAVSAIVLITDCVAMMASLFLSSLLDVEGIVIGAPSIMLWAIILIFFFSNVLKKKMQFLLNIAF